MRDGRQPPAKITSETVRLHAKQPSFNSLIVAAIVTVSSVPKNLVIETPSKSRRKLPTTLKLELSSATEISVRSPFANAITPSSRTSEPKNSDESSEQLAQTLDSMRESLEPDSNVTAERNPQSEKHSAQRVSTAAGMQIDESDPHCANARASIDEITEPGSNVTVERAAHSQKQFAPSFSTEKGMQIDESDEQHQNTP
jgi:hypothetical protein